jgi:hypothetical protein
VFTVSLQNGHCKTETPPPLNGGDARLIEAATIWERENEPCNEIILRSLRIAGFSDRATRGVLALSQAIGSYRHEVVRSQAAIASRLSIDESTVSRYLDAIEDAQVACGRVFIAMKRCGQGEREKARFTGYVRPTVYEVFKRAVRNGCWKIQWKDALEATDNLLDELAQEVLSLLPQIETPAAAPVPDDPVERAERQSAEEGDMAKRLEDRHRKTYVDLGAFIDDVSDPTIAAVSLERFQNEHARKIANLERRLANRMSRHRQLQQAQRELAPLDYALETAAGGGGVSLRNPGVEEDTTEAGNLVSSNFQTADKVAGNKIPILETKELDSLNEQDPDLEPDGYLGSREAEPDENFESPPSIFEAAKHYIDEGLRVCEVYGVEPSIPPRCLCSKGPKCPTPGKHPRGGIYTQKPPERWAATSSVGIATGNGLVVLDVDPRNGGDESLAQLRAAGLVTETRIAATGGGGLHFFYSTPPGVKVPNCEPLPGLEVKSDGYMVVAAPSRHASGKRYEWVNEVDIAPLPEDLLDLIVATKVVTYSKPKTYETPGKVVSAVGTGFVVHEGERNNRMFRYLCALRGKGYSDAEIREAAFESNTFYQPPLDDDELEKIIRSACRF